MNTLTMLDTKDMTDGGLFDEDVANALQSFTDAFDDMSEDIIYAAPSCATTVTTNKNKLDAALQAAVCDYSPGGDLGITGVC